MSPDSRSALKVDIDACPPDWREVPLSSVADIRFSSVDKKSVSGETPVRLCNYTDVYNNDYITVDMEFMRATATLQEIDRFCLQSGDVLITKDSETPNDIGVPTVVDSTAPDLVCGYHLALIRPHQRAIDSTFLAKQLSHCRLVRYFGQQANGTTRYGLSTSAIAGALLQLPTVDQQQAVSRIARLLDVVIEKTAAVIAKLKRVRTGLVHDLLTYGVDRNGCLRNPKQHPEQFMDSPIGRIPKHWAMAPLLSRVALPEGQVDPRLSPFRDWLLVAPDHVESGTGRLLARLTATEQGAISGKYVFEPNDVVYSKIRPYLCKAILAIERGLCSADMYPLRPSDGVSPRFLLAVILGHPFTRFASAVSMRSGFPKINQTELAQYQLAWPPSTEQREIAAILASTDNKQAVLEAELTKLKQLKTGLMSDLLSGLMSAPKKVEMEAAS